MINPMSILAIDLGKSKGVYCDYRAGEGVGGFGSVKVSREAIAALLHERRPQRLVIEIGPAAGWVHDLARDLGIQVQVANTNHVAWRWKHTKRKTDRRDAQRLAELSAMNQLPTVHMPDEATRQWRSLITYRKTLVKRRTQIKNTIRATLDCQGLSMPAGKSGWTKQTLASLRAMTRLADGALWRLELETELDLLESQEAAIRTVEQQLDAIAREDVRVQRLRSAPAVGPRLSEAIVAVIDDPHRFTRGRDVGSYIGLTPRQFQSGSMNRQGRISGQGSKMLRALLVQVAWLGVSRMKVPWMVQAYEQVRRGSDARKKIAIVAVARRLLIRCWAMLRDASPWREPPRGVRAADAPPNASPPAAVLRLAG